jgi:peptide/nickel transport system substrate-binding protein/oligopeptide transport system substrate-binding protein
MKFKSIKIASALIAGALVLAGCSSDSSDSADGGSITVSYQNDIATLDPAIGYDWQNWSIIKSLFSRVLDYKPGTDTLVPDLATEMPTISADGKTFEITLRDDAVFHNGRSLTADDVKYSIERAVNPKTQSPGAGFFASIDGFDAASAGDTTDLSGIVVNSPTSLTITLSRADATFLHVLAINFASVVPKEEVEKYGEDFGKNPVGSGAFKFTSWTLGQKLVLDKNPDYYTAGVPKVGQINFEVGIDPTVALQRLKNGEVDILGDSIPAADYIAESGDSKNKDRIVEGGQLQTGYVTLNVKMKPFDNVKVRQAINHAIDKDRITQIINGRAVAANQPLPPSMPGYDKNYKGFEYNVARAKALLAEAGLAAGFSTELWTSNTDPNPRIAQSIQQDLAAIGIKVAIKSLAQANVIEAGSNGKAPMVWSGGMAWIADFPDPSNFWGPILGCGGAVPGGWNWSQYCNKALDAEAVKADSMTDPKMAADRNKLWSSIFTRAMDEAPWVPIFNEKRITMKSDRLGGDVSLYVDPVHIPVNYDHIFIKK